MLLKFNFKNYKSFKDEVSLDLTATKISEYSDRNFEAGNVKVLPIVGILGANASGKSNVMEAFRFMIDYIVFSLNFAGAQINPNVQISAMRPIPFLFDNKSKMEGTTFETYFVINNDKTEKIYQYGFVINGNVVEEEWLNYKAKTSRDDFKTIFYHSQKENDFSGLDKNIVKNIEVSIQKETLILTLGAKLKEKILSEIYNWFATIIDVDLSHINVDTILNNAIWNYKPLLEKSTQDSITKYLSSFDDNIIGIEVKEKEINPITKEKKKEIYIKHKNGNKGEGVQLPFLYESAGTRRMFYLYPLFDIALRMGSPLFIDELNLQLHPLLIRVILQMFLNKNINKNKAQLVFTSHDVWQLKSDILRRDEIWFTEKDDKGVSNLYSLSDFVGEDGEKIRKDEDFQKNYLMGKYGAIPDLKGFDGVFK